ncbi:hypothetical protein FA95DRAFT_1605059, partial [Auriscalpium vulgare]
PDGLSEPYQSAAAVGSASGDPQGKYVALLAQKEPAYPKEPWFFWYQPLSDNGWVRANVGSTSGASGGGGGGGNSSDGGGGNSSSGAGSSGAQSKNCARGGVCALAAVMAGVVGSLAAFLV